MAAMVNPVDRLLQSDEPSVRWRVMTGVLGESAESARVRKVQEEIRSSPRVRAMLAPRLSNDRFPGHPYAKYWGVHWTLATLADIGYPPGDESLIPLRDQVYEAWLHPMHVLERVVDREASGKKGQPGVPIIKGRARRCASQEGNALYATLALGIADDRSDQLAANLCRWQWSDGGWNCDRRAEAHVSSFHESLIPLRGLSLHAHLCGNEGSRAASIWASELFLRRRLYRRIRDGHVINSSFKQIRYPHQWQYDFFFGLKVLSEVGYIGDPRCVDALDLLESMRLSDGGFGRTNRDMVSSEMKHGSVASPWGATSRTTMNEWVAADALTVLAKAGRLPSG